MAVALVQSKSGRATSGTHTVTLDAAPTAGNLILAFFATNSTAAQTAPAGFTLLTTRYAGTASQVLVYYKVAGAGESSSVAVTPAVGSQWDLHVAEFSGVPTPTVDRVAQADSGTTTVTTLSAGPTANLIGTGDLVIAVLSLNASVTGITASGFTTLQTTQRAYSGYLIDSNQAPKTAVYSWTGTGRAVGQMIAISPTAIALGGSGWGFVNV